MVARHSKTCAALTIFSPRHKTAGLRRVLEKIQSCGPGRRSASLSSPRRRTRFVIFGSCPANLQRRVRRLRCSWCRPVNRPMTTYQTNGPRLTTASLDPPPLYSGHHCHQGQNSAGAGFVSKTACESAPQSFELSPPRERLLFSIISGWSGVVGSGQCRGQFFMLWPRGLPFL